MGDFKNGIPSDDTIARNISLINPEEFQQCFIKWMADAAFDEDRCRAGNGFSAENLAIARQVTLNILKRYTSVKAGIRNKPKYCGWYEDYIMKVPGLIKI